MQGNLINRVMESSVREPEVGMGATETMWSDRHAGTIVAVRRFASGKRKGQIREVDWQADKATRTDSNGMSDCQSYTYEPDRGAPVKTFRADVRGVLRPCPVDPDSGQPRMSKYGALVVGVRDEHYDYSF